MAYIHVLLFKKNGINFVCSNNQRQDVRHIHPAAMPVRGQTSGRGRGGTHRTLYDPKNPTKHSKSNAAPQVSGWEEWHF